MTTIEQLIPEIDGRIARLMPESGPAAPLFDMMRYHLGWVDEAGRPTRGDPGKRVRARLCLLTCQATGSSPDKAMAAATAVELVHNFSLIHDDIQDGSEYRRHRRTVWTLWGSAQAINAGDGMFALAQLALAEEESEPRVVVRALRALNLTCRLLCEGQYLDLEYERRPTISVEDYIAMIERKTGALIETSCLLGALFGGAGDVIAQAYASFGRHLGRAFQIQDDHLGIWGDPSVTGKPAAADIASKKKTLPLLFALGATSGRDRARLESVLGREGEAEGGEVAEVLEILGRCGASEYTAAEVGRASEAALAALDQARPEPAAHEQLAALCRRMALRKR